MKKKIQLTGALLAVGALALAGCTADTPTTGGGAAEVAPGFLAVADDSLAKGGTLSVYLDYDSVEVNGLNPQTADTARSWMLLGLSYDTLVSLDENFEPTPGVAESWEIVSPTEYVFTLRDDATFSNGRVVTADDVKGSLDMLLANPGSSWAGQVGAIEEVEITGEHEVTLHLSTPSTPLLGALAHVATSILPIAEIEAGEIDITTDLVGSGAYVATSHVQDESWTFEKNPYYHAVDDLGIDVIDIEIAADEASRLAAIRDGSADYAFFNNPDALDLLAGTPEAAAVPQQNTDLFFAIFNSVNPDSPFHDPQVRLAVNAMIDRQELADIAFGGTATPTGITPFALPDACNADDVPSAQLSDDEIRQILADAGAEGMSLSLLTWNSETGPGVLAQVIQQQLAEFDVNLELQIADDGIWGDALYGDPAIAWEDDMSITWYAGYGDASMVTNWFNTDVHAFPARYMTSTPEINQLIVEGAELPAGPERAASFTELCNSLDENSEIVPLVSRPGVIAYRTDTVSPTINSNEGYGDILRFISDFRMISGN